MVTVYLGTYPTVYLNSYEVIKDAFVNSGLKFAGRPTDMFTFSEVCKHKGKQPPLTFNDEFKHKGTVSP